MSSPVQNAANPAASGVIPFDAGHLAQGLAMTQALNWPYRAQDWAFALRLGRGFAIENDGQLVGTTFWWPYGETYGSVGMIIVAPDAQRQGIGARLMAALLADTANRTLVLNSTSEGEALYSRLGFKPYGVVQQRQAVINTAPALDDGVPLRAARPEDRATLETLDHAASGMARGMLLDAIFEIADVLVVERDGCVMGYGCVRRWGRGFVVGPVAARDMRDAKALISALAARHVGDFVRIDVTDAGGLGSWLGTLGLPQTDRAIAMSLGEPPQGDPEMTLFALSNQSLG